MLGLFYTSSAWSLLLCPLYVEWLSSAITSLCLSQCLTHISHCKICLIMTVHIFVTNCSSFADCACRCWPPGNIREKNFHIFLVGLPLISNRIFTVLVWLPLISSSIFTDLVGTPLISSSIFTVHFGLPLISTSIFSVLVGLPLPVISLFSLDYSWFQLGFWISRWTTPWAVPTHFTFFLGPEN